MRGYCLVPELFAKKTVCAGVSPTLLDLAGPTIEVAVRESCAPLSCHRES